MPLLTEKPLFLFISQSGETADCRAVLVKVKEMGYKTLTLTNVKGSTLSRESDNTLLLYAGPEIAVASTKAYTAQIAVLSILATLVNNNININIFKELSKIAFTMETLCDDKDNYKNLAKKYLVNSRNCFYIGRSMDYFVCLEASLKLKEISYIHAEGYPAAEMKHGPIALISQEMPVVVIATNSSTYEKVISNIQEIKARKGKIIYNNYRRR